MTALLAALVVMPLAPFHAEAAVSDWQKGISIYPRSTTDYGSDGFRSTVDSLQSLGFTYVTLIIPYYQSNVGSSDIQRGGNTPTDAALESAISYVHSKGMHVMLKVHLDTYDGQWRAYINPSGSTRTAWFANYGAMLMHYAGIAAKDGVEEFALGTELVSMSTATSNSDNTAQWQRMIANVRSAYGGQLTYDANWGGDYFTDEAQHVAFWGSLDAIGISAYYNLDTDGSVSSLEAAWNNWNNSDIRPLSQQYGKPILFSEVGYRSSTDAHKQPWNPNYPGGYDAQEQVNDYTALFHYWNDYPYMEGIDMWYAVADPNAGGAGNTDYLIQNKPVSSTIAQWFKDPAAPQGGSTGSPAFTATGSASASSVSTGQAVSLSATVADTGSATAGAVVDMEVYDAGGSKIFQKYFSNETFSAGQSKTYAASWTPSSTGTYALKIGVFPADWSSYYVWNNSAATITVGAPSGTGSGSGSGSGTGGGTASGPQALDVWWPADGSTISGVQPFKAMLENTDPSAYSMYWQVDGGQLNPMADNAQDYPHKEAAVDVSSWNWHGNGPYVVNFIAKGTDGATIQQKPVTISVVH